jgi:hypothetical protein
MRRRGPRDGRSTRYPARNGLLVRSTARNRLLPGFACNDQHSRPLGSVQGSSCGMRSWKQAILRDGAAARRCGRPKTGRSTRRCGRPKAMVPWQGWGPSKAGVLHDDVGARSQSFCSTMRPDARRSQPPRGFSATPKGRRATSRSGAAPGDAHVARGEPAPHGVEQRGPARRQAGRLALALVGRACRIDLRPRHSNDVTDSTALLRVAHPHWPALHATRVAEADRALRVAHRHALHVTRTTVVGRRPSAVRAHRPRSSLEQRAQTRDRELHRATARQAPTHRAISSICAMGHSPSP